MKEMTRMEKIAYVLDVKIGEKFLIKTSDGKIDFSHIYYLSDESLEVIETEPTSDLEWTLGEILDWDDIELIKEPFPEKPKKKKYYRYAISGKITEEPFRKDTGFYEDYNSGNFFLTMEEAKEKGPVLIKKLKEKYRKEVNEELYLK